MNYLDFMSKYNKKEITLQRLMVAITVEDFSRCDLERINRLFAIFSLMELLKRDFDINDYLFTEIYDIYNSATYYYNNRIYDDIAYCCNKSDKFTKDDFKYHSPLTFEKLSSFCRDDLKKIVSDLVSLINILSQEYVKEVV